MKIDESTVTGGLQAGGVTAGLDERFAPRVIAGQTRRSLKSLAIHGSILTIVAYGAGQILRLGSNLILARLLFPEAFGLMALLHVFRQGLHMLSDTGIHSSIIQDERGDDSEFLNTAWTIQVIRGCGLWIIACILAWPAAWLFSRNDPLGWQLTELIPVIGLTVLMHGFNSTYFIRLNRHLLLGRMTVLNLASQLLGIVVMVSWALVHRSVWALVAGSLAAAALQLILSHLMVWSTRNRFHWDRDSVRALFTFGKWIFVSTAITFLAMQADRLLLSNLVPLGVLGVYSIGLMFASLPKEIVSRLNNAVLFPLLSNHTRTNKESLSGKVQQARRIVLPAATCILLPVTLLAPSFFQLLYDDRYHDAGWMAQLLCISVWFSMLIFTSGSALLAIGNTRALAISNAANVVVTIAGCLIGFFLFGMTGFVLGFALGTLAGLVVIQSAMARQGIPILYDDLKYSVILGLFLATGLLAPEAIAQVLAVNLPAMTLQLGIAGILIVACGIWAISRSLPVLLNRSPLPVALRHGASTDL